MNKVSIVVMGNGVRDVFFRKDETIGGIALRLDSCPWPLRKVDSWYANSAKVSAPGAFKLRDGMTIVGSPRMTGSCGAQYYAPAEQTARLAMPGWNPFVLNFAPGSSLQDCLDQRGVDRGPSRPVDLWVWRYGEVTAAVQDPAMLALSQGMTIHGE